MRNQTSSGSKLSGKIGYVLKCYPRFSETFIVNEILAHEKAGLDIDIFSLRPTQDTHFQNLISQVRAPVTYLPSASVRAADLWSDFQESGISFPELWQILSTAKFASVLDIYQAIQLAKAVRDRNIVHLHAHFASVATTVTRLAAKIAGISYSVTMHAKDIFHESVQYEELAEKIADAEFVVTVSEFNRQFLVERFGFEEKIHRIYNGLDLDVFEFNPAPRNQQRIISVGRLVYKKGFRHLINACRILSDRQADFSCEIIGSGELENELRNQIDSLGLEGRVTLTGPLPQNIVRQKISAATVFAAPCVVGEDGNRDGLPTVITESLALGTPCIATDVTGIPEIIKDGETGIIVSQGNELALADQLEKILADHELRESFSVNGRKLIEDCFDIHRNVSVIRERFLQPNSSIGSDKQRTLVEV